MNPGERNDKCSLNRIHGALADVVQKRGLQEIGVRFAGLTQMAENRKMVRLGRRTHSKEQLAKVARQVAERVGSA